MFFIMCLIYLFLKKKMFLYLQHVFLALVITISKIFVIVVLAI